MIFSPIESTILLSLAVGEFTVVWKIFTAIHFQYSLKRNNTQIYPVFVSHGRSLCFGEKICCNWLFCSFSNHSLLPVSVYLFVMRFVTIPPYVHLYSKLSSFMLSVCYSTNSSCATVFLVLDTNISLQRSCLIVQFARYFLIPSCCFLPV